MCSEFNFHSPIKIHAGFARAEACTIIYIFSELHTISFPNKRTKLLNMNFINIFHFHSNLDHAICVALSHINFIYYKIIFCMHRNIQFVAKFHITINKIHRDPHT